MQHQALVERDERGRQLVKESGPMLRLGFDAGWDLRRGGAVQWRGEFAAGTLNYEGQTWHEVPLQSKTDLRELDVSFAWRPLRPAQWGEAWFVLRGEWQHRGIDSTSGASGLSEDSRVLLPGLRWTHSFQAASWRWQPSVELRASVFRDLHADLGDWYYDHQDGGHRRDVALGLDVTLASPWSVGVAWTRTRESASPTHTLGDGDPSWGWKRKTHFEIDNVMLRVRRAF